MTWKKIKDEKPPLEKLVIVWQPNRKKYAILKLCDDQEETPNSLYWLTQGNTCQNINGEESWCTFEYLKETIIYD